MKNHYARKKRQLKSLIKKLLFLLSDIQNKNLIFLTARKIRQLITSISFRIPYKLNTKQMRVTALLLGMGIGATKAQSFLTPVISPFGLSGEFETSEIQSFGDLDGDGDQDVLTIVFQTNPETILFNYKENTGLPIAPDFTTDSQTNVFGLNDSLDSPEFLTLVDIDNDGDLDILTAVSYTGSIKFYQNTGTVNAPTFTEPIVNPFGIEPVASGNQFINFGDIDNDGDLDMISSVFFFTEGQAKLFFSENIGTAESPQFTPRIENFFALDPAVIAPLEVAVQNYLADVDNDGDLDLMVSGYYNEYKYYENIGNPQSPQFTTPTNNPFGFSGADEEVLIGGFVDIDSDGDMDFITSDYYGVYKFYEQITFDGIESTFTNEQINIYPSPTTGIVNLDLENKEFEVEIFDVIGKSVSISKNIKTLDLSKLPKGTYILKITIKNEGHIVQKIIKI